jgi:hypothetical protein
MNPSAVKLYESREFPHELNLPVPRRREEKVMRSLFRRFRQEISLSLSLSLSLSTFPSFLAGRSREIAWRSFFSFDSKISQVGRSRGPSKPPKAFRGLTARRLDPHSAPGAESRPNYSRFRGKMDHGLKSGLAGPAIRIGRRDARAQIALEGEFAGGLD